MKLTKTKFKDLAQLSNLRFTPEQTELYRQDLDLIIDFTQKSEQTKTRLEVAEPIFTLYKAPPMPRPEERISKATFNKHFSFPYFRIPQTRERNG
jgi:Asp-tRNA(Asn)/Glu-tRNA(Gln) amidotransferase C subunit